jgi:hypothetical protein
VADQPLPLRRLRRLDDTRIVGWLPPPRRVLAAISAETMASVIATGAALAAVLLGGPIRNEMAFMIVHVMGVPFLTAVVIFRLARALAQTVRRALLPRAVLARAARVTTRVADLRALPRTPDGTLVVCRGRVRCRRPLQLPGEGAVIAAAIRFAGPSREDMSVSDFSEPRRRLGRRGDLDATRPLFFSLTRPLWTDAIFEVAQDFEIVGDDEAAVAVAAADAQLVATPSKAFSDPIHADAVLAALGAPLAAAGATDGLYRFLRDGDTVEVFGFKDTSVSPDAAAADRLEREPPLGALVRGRPDQPLLIVPVA